MPGVSPLASLRPLQRALCAFGLVCASTAGGAVVKDDFANQVNSFFEEHCLDCHEQGTTKGGLDLTKANLKMEGVAQTDLWTHVFDRLERGEMPPAKKPRPPQAKIDQLLASIRPRLFAADRARREVTQRRLNRREYENTVRDLLAIDIELQQLLPEDQQAGGFDNNGDALAISTEQMQGYLEAARAAVDAAIVTTPQPKTETWTTDSLSEVQKYIDAGDFGYEDGRIISYVTTQSDYSKISTRAKRTPVRGKYQFKFQAAGHNSSDLQFFTLSASNFAGVAAKSKNLGYFEVGPEPKTFTVEAVLDAKYAVQFFPLGLPGYIKKTPGTKFKGVGFGPVEVTGPIISSWPPESHRRLLGETDLKTGAVADAERILRTLLPKAFRRPVAEAEIEPYIALVKNRMDAGRGFHQSLRAGLIAVLCSPDFIYLKEAVRSDTTRVSDHELASRLSYFLWSTAPDEALATLANQGKLRDAATLRAQVARMLKDEKAQAFVTNFTGQWLRLRQINDTTPDKKLYKDFDELLQVSMVREGESFFRNMLEENRPVSEFIDSDWAMLNQRLAAHYGVDGVQGFGLRKVKLPADCVRGGVLTMAGVLKVTANGTTTSPVLRGTWVLDSILGQPTPPPPPNTGGIEPDIRGATTIREQLDKHRHVESCNACHRKIDPPGFALESFDPTGAYRQKYLRWVVTNAEKNYGNVQPGANVDPSGTMPTGEEFSDIRELKKLLLKQQAQFAHCVTEKLLTYGLGRELGFSDRDAVNAIIRQSQQSGGGFRTLLENTIASELFATR